MSELWDAASHTETNAHSRMAYLINSDLITRFWGGSEVNHKKRPNQNPKYAQIPSLRFKRATTDLEFEFSPPPLLRPRR